MPIYVFENERGEVREEFRTVARRNDVPPGWRRITACRTATVIPGAVLDPTSADAAVPRAFKELEATMPVAEIERRTGYSRNKIKETWNIK